MSLLVRRRDDGVRMTLDEYAQMVNSFNYQGVMYTLSDPAGFQQTLAGGPTERVGTDFAGASNTYRGNSVIFACMAVRQAVFSTPMFRWQTIRNGKGSDMFGTSDLRALEAPWPGGTTQDLLTRMIQDVDLVGNAYLVRNGSDIVRLRPDWCDLVLEPRAMGARTPQGTVGIAGYRKVGLIYTEGGTNSGNEPVPFDLDEFAHWAPNPDPTATWRGMSWLTPVVREVQADYLMTRHKRRFFENGATPNLVVTHHENADPEKVRRFKEKMDEKHRGVDNAYKTLHLYPGADATIVGADLKSIDFKNVQGAGETRIAAAAGVPPVIVGLSEGLAAATYSNYSQARRRFADGTIHPLWQNVCGVLAPIMPSMGPGVRLWYDVSDVAFLREDEKDAAEIASVRAATIRSYVEAGFTPESAVLAVDSDDLRLLEHTGLYSVQLQPPGSIAPPPSATPALPASEGAES